MRPLIPVFAAVSVLMAFLILGSLLTRMQDELKAMLVMLNNVLRMLA